MPVITLPLAGLSDTLVVTATRTEESLRDVPLSISAFSGADIERRDLEDAAELAHWTPGLTVVDQGARGRDVLIVRGLHTDSLNGFGAGDTGVATYLGDVPVDVDRRLGDIERVEVLLGPQGTLYGAGTLADAVTSLVARTPGVARSTCAPTCSDSRTAGPQAPTSASPSICRRFAADSRCAGPSTASPTPASSTTTTC